ncbi:phage tail protein [Pseudocitrobacter faecalis]|uniref:phage tail-collar fiber domain-containing protein n=1 Tax=Pseudocitrobacter faecalis TaxID=1398493 RepID=UPI0039EE5BE2
MSQAVITQVFEQWKAQQAATNEAVTLDEFVFAHVPDLDVDTPIDRNEVMPPASQIVHRQAVSRTGVVNDNAVVYSVVLGADTGDFTFNWVGLINKASGTLAMIVHAPEQQKLKTKEGQQGNVLTRSFLMEFNGAQAETNIDTPAETWQIDFTARMAGMDERQRLENVDIYGAGAFFDDGYLVAKNGTQYFVTKGAGYVAGLRSALAANQNITVTTKPVKVWLDVSWTGTLTSAWDVQQKITVAATHTDYVQDGIQHYVFALASIDANGSITDLRPKGGLTDQALKEHEKSRNHPDGTLTAKGFVQLSSATDSASEVLAATPKAVKAANDNANGRVPSTRKVNGHTLSSDITLSFDDVGALSAGVMGVIRDGMTMASANKPGWWQVAVANTATVSDFPKYPDGSRLYGYGYLFVDMTTNSWLQHYYNHRGVNAKRQDWNVGPTASIPWIIDFNTANVPTAADVDAVSSKNGGRFYAKVEFGSVVIFEKSYPGLTLRDNDSADSFVGKDLTIESSKGNVHLLWRKKDSTDGQVKLDFPKVNGTIYSTGNKPSAGDVGAYTKAEADSQFQPKGNYTPVGTAYTKAEADARFVSDVQLGAGTKVTTYNIAGNWPNRSGYVITSVFKDLNDYNLDGIHYAPLQKKIGATWYTVSGGTV